MRFVTTLYAVLLLLAAPAVADPPSEPQLRIETGMHTARIGRLGIDAEGRLLV